MAVNLGKRNINTGVQGNKKTSRIPNQPSGTVGVANDPGVAGGPRNIPQGAFGTEGGGAFAKGLQDASLNTIDAIQERQTALLTAEEKRQLGESKNASALSLAAAKSDYEALRKGATYQDKEANDKFEKDFTAISPKYQSTMAGAVTESDFQNELNILEIQQSSLASQEKTGAEIISGTARAEDAIDEHIASYGAATLDPETEEANIEAVVERTAGNLPQQNKNVLIRKKLQKLAERQLLQMSKGFGGVGDDGRAEIKAYMARPYIQALVGEDFIDKVQTSQISIAEEKESAGVEERKRKAALKEIEDRQTRYEKFVKDAPDADTLAYKTAVFFALEKGELAAPIKAAPGEVLIAPALTKTPSQPVAKGEVKTNVTSVAEDANVAVTQSDQPGTVTVLTPEGGEKRPDNPLHQGVSASGRNILSEHANTELRRLSNLTIGITADSVGRVVTSGENAFVRDVMERAGELVMDDNDGGLTAIKAINQAVDQIPEGERPTTFNYQEVGRRRWDGMDSKKVQKGIQHPVTREGGAALTAEIQAGLQGLESKINTLASQGKIRPEDATGWWSGLSVLIGSTVGNVFDGAVSTETQRARFQFGLLARDFIRLVTLSPRFAVKEQELLAKIFTGPDAFLSSGQAKIQIEEFETFLNSRGPEVVEELGFPADNEAKNKLLRELTIMKSIQTRISQFDLGNTGRLNTEQIDNTPASDYKQWTDEEFKEKTGYDRVGTVPVATAPTAPQASPAIEPEVMSQGAPKEEVGQLEPLRRAMKSGDFSKVTVADMFEGLALLDLSQMDFDVIKGELASLGEDVPDDLRPKKKNKKKSNKKVKN